uniref:Uncharacterized protein n=1 Tax=Aplanochytrium stocchinoi TaxID=215587 RepID=A0A7S3PMH5_9STRA|mmetsp:Transcript_15067/g.18631  ORF Transcript_15067/g.18631 Transcript_15067/m.18631 type:complete len:168 (-) Transcript_15067:796-1299(-)
MLVQSGAMSLEVELEIERDTPLAFPTPKSSSNVIEKKTMKKADNMNMKNLTNITEVEEKDQDEEKQSKTVKHSLHLQVDGTKQSGILTTAMNSARVNILKLNNKGDALIHDGKRIMMVAAQHVTLAMSEQDIGFKRLQFVKKIYFSLLKGEIVDTSKIYVEAQKWLL